MLVMVEVSGGERLVVVVGDLHTSTACEQLTITYTVAGLPYILSYLARNRIFIKIVTWASTIKILLINW